MISSQPGFKKFCGRNVVTTVQLTSFKLHCSWFMLFLPPSLPPLPSSPLPSSPPPPLPSSPPPSLPLSLPPSLPLSLCLPTSPPAFLLLPPFSPRESPQMAMDSRSRTVSPFSKLSPARSRQLPVPRPPSAARLPRRPSPRDSPTTQATPSPSPLAPSDGPPSLSPRAASPEALRRRVPSGLTGVPDLGNRS